MKIVDNDLAFAKDPSDLDDWKLSDCVDSYVNHLRKEIILLRNMVAKLEDEKHQLLMNAAVESSRTSLRTVAALLSSEDPAALARGIMKIEGGE